MAEKARIEAIDVSAIKVGERTRFVSEPALSVLSASYEDQGGFTTPIHVRKDKDGYELIDGAHRLEVAKRLGLETILARIWACSKQQARFLEVDANVSQADLTPVALARSLALRHEAYVKLHPGTGAGTAGGLARQGQQAKDFSFAEFVAEARGLSTRRIQQIIKAGKSLSAKEAEALEKAPRRITVDDLSELSAITEAEERDFVVKSLVAGEVKKAKAARKAWKAETGTAPAPANQTEQSFARLSDAWKRAPKVARARFLEVFAEQIQTELQELVDGLTEGDDA